MELRLALPVLLDALGDYRVDPARIIWKRSFALRGPTSLRLTPGEGPSSDGRCESSPPLG